MKDVCIALDICTYKREKYIRKSLEELQNSRFFDPEDKVYYGGIHIFIVDNASELTLSESRFICLIHNRNTGGSGGFQRGLDEIRASDTSFSHVVFMDDDVRFEAEALYILYDFLCVVDETEQDRPVAGRMFDLDNPNIQWTAAEIWNKGNIAHVEFTRDVSKPDKNGKKYEYGRVVYDCGADYGGWWFCCYPMEFVEKNDIMPFFLHCDDVEYGLRCGKSPIIIEGVQVWHETWEKRKSPYLLYYDTRNTLFVNEKYGLQPPVNEVFGDWKKRISAYHVQRDWLSEYMVICGMGDFLRGMRWLEHLDSEMYHKRITGMKSNRVKNAVAWRWVAFKFKRKYKNNREKD